MSREERLSTFKLVYIDVEYFFSMAHHVLRQPIWTPKICTEFSKWLDPELLLPYTKFTTVVSQRKLPDMLRAQRI